MKAKHATDAELREIALAAVPPSGTMDCVAYVEHTPGGTLPNGTPNGLGGHTRYGAAWFDGLKTSEPFALFDNQKDAFRLINLVTGEEGELWRRKEVRRARIAELDAAEAAAAAEAKETERSLRKLAKKGVDIAEATGGGSSRRSRSSEKPSASTRVRLRVEDPALSRTA